MDLDAALALVLTRCAGASAPPGRYPVWADDDGAWQASGPDHWAAGFVTGARWLAQVCGVSPSDGPVPTVPANVETSSFHAFTGWYAGGTTAAGAAVARRLAEALLPSGALAVTEGDLRAEGGHAVAYVDAVGPAAALLSHHVAPEVGARHAQWTLRTLQQADGSLLQCARVDVRTGSVDKVYTAAQGYGGASRWSRAQAWGLLGAALAPAGSVVAEGRALADWWLATTPRGAAPPWDFDAPAGGPVDTSAGAIAAVALLRLAGSETGARADAYRRAGLELVRALLGHVAGTGALRDGCYHLPAGLAPANELVWGDYYLAEALALATGAVSPSWVPTPRRPPGRPASAPTRRS